MASNSQGIRGLLPRGNKQPRFGARQYEEWDEKDADQDVYGDSKQ